MGRPPAYGLAGPLFALVVAVAFAPAAGAQPPPVVAPPLNTPPKEGAPMTPPVEAPPAPVEAPVGAAPVPPPRRPAPEQPPEVVEAELLALAPRPRPRLSLAIGFGATRDPAGFSDGGHFIPAFFGVGGFGDGLIGVDLGAFSSAASGRFPTTDSPVDRLALDAFAVLRPAAGVHPDDQRYGMRVLRTVGLELGLGFERDGQVVISGSRWVIHSGARVEFPLTTGQAGELRLRLAMRRAFGLYTPELSTQSGSNGTVSVGDSTELYGALAVVF